MCQRLVMRFLSFQRQILVMMRLGNRADTFDDRLPVISFIVAVENIPIRGAGENCIAAVPHVHRHAFDIGADMIGQTARENIPALAAVAAASDTRVGGVEFSPRAWPRLRAGDEQ